MTNGKKLNLKNIGLKTEKWLIRIGIDSYEKLNEVGSVQAYKEIKSLYPEANKVCLYALEGALWGINWTLLPESIKKDLVAKL